MKSICLILVTRMRIWTHDRISPWGGSLGAIFGHVFKSEVWWLKYKAYDLHIIYNSTLQHELTWIDVNRCYGWRLAVGGWRSNIFRYSTVTWVSGLIAKYLRSNVRTKETTNLSSYISCKVISGYYHIYIKVLSS